METKRSSSAARISDLNFPKLSSTMMMAWLLLQMRATTEQELWHRTVLHDDDGMAVGAAAAVDD